MTNYPTVDANGKDLHEGDSILIPLKKGGFCNEAHIKRVTIVKIADEYTHRGYGVYTQKIKVFDGNRHFWISYPQNTIKEN